MNDDGLTRSAPPVTYALTGERVTLERWLQEQRVFGPEAAGAFAHLARIQGLGPCSRSEWEAQCRAILGAPAR